MIKFSIGEAIMKTISEIKINTEVLCILVLLIFPGVFSAAAGCAAEGSGSIVAGPVPAVPGFPPGSGYTPAKDPDAWKKWERHRYRKNSPYPELMSELALPEKELPKVIKGHPRLLVRAEAWDGGLSVSQLRQRIQKGKPGWNAVKKYAGEAKRNPIRCGEKYGEHVALYYLCTGDETVIPGIIQFILKAKPSYKCGGGLVGVCKAYDWIYNSTSLTDDDRKKMADHIVKVAFQCAKAQEASDAGDILHHRGAGGWTCDVLVAGLTLFHEHPDGRRLLAWGAGYMKNALFPAWARFKGDHMGGGHRYYRAGAGKLPVGIACWHSAAEPDICAEITEKYNDFLQGNMYAMMYQTLPDKTRVESTGFDRAPRHLMQGNFMSTAWCYKNPDAYAYLRWLGHDPKKFVFFYNEKVDRKKPSLPISGPSVRFWGGTGKGWFGYVQMRSNGWQPDSAVIEFKCGDRFWSHGFNTNQNSFYIYKKGRLAPHTGFYSDRDKHGNYLYFGEHMRNYYCQTVACNSMLIIDPEEWCHTSKLVLSNQDEKGFYPVYGSQIIHRGGSNCFSFDKFMSMMKPGGGFECGDITAFEYASDLSYTYVCGNATKNYNSPHGCYGNGTAEKFGRAKNRPKIDLFTRSLAWLDNRYLIVFDRVNALDLNFRKAWVLHSLGKPEVNGKKIDVKAEGHIEDFDSDMVTIDWQGTYIPSTDPKDPGRLFSKTFLPKKHYVRRIGGKGYEFWASGRNWEPLSRPKGPPNPKSDQMDVGEWRVEVSPSSPSKFNNFLHLLFPCDTKTGKMPPAEIAESKEGTMIGLSVGNWIALFGKKGEVTENFSYACPRDKTRHLIVDLKPNTAYRISGRGTEPLDMTSSTQGTLRFVTLKQTKITIMPK